MHVCKVETLQAAYKLAKENNGAPGIDGVTFESVEGAGRAEFLEQLRESWYPARTCPNGCGAWEFRSPGENSGCSRFLRSVIEWSRVR